MQGARQSRLLCRPPSDDEIPQEEHVESAKDVQIFARSWSAAGKPRAVLVICHGVNRRLEGLKTLTLNKDHYPRS
jgi:hypothetical protein